MRALSTNDGGESSGSGGIVGYPLERLHEEVAYIAYHFHWPLDAIFALEHRDRVGWVEEIAKINRRYNQLPTLSSP